MFKENDKVYVPRHTHMGWQPSIVVVKYKGDDGRWWCEIERNDYQGIPRLVNISFYSYEMFLIKEDEPNKAYNNCKSYIMRRYTDYYCNACEYKGKEAGIWSCHSCISHYDCKYGVDDKHEICSKFSPYRTVDREEYVDFDTYIDRLKNCDFNPNCEFHRMSVFKTCSFNRYMSE